MSDVPILDTRLGNRTEDAALARRIEREAVERVVLDGDQRRRSRFRARTEAGTEVGIVAGGDALRRGDVLAGEDLTVVVDLAGCEAVALDFGGVDGDGRTLAAAAALGHRIGNRHRDLATRGPEVLVAVGDDDPERLRAALESADGVPPGARVRIETVDPSLFDAANAPDHDHDHGGALDRGAGHDHEHGRGHEGEHDYGTDHDREAQHDRGADRHRPEGAADDHARGDGDRHGLGGDDLPGRGSAPDDPGDGTGGGH